MADDVPRKRTITHPLHPEFAIDESDLASETGPPRENPWVEKSSIGDYINGLKQEKAESRRSRGAGRSSSRSSPNESSSSNFLDTAGNPGNHGSQVNRSEIVETASRASDPPYYSDSSPMSGLSRSHQYHGTSPLEAHTSSTTLPQTMQRNPPPSDELMNNENDAAGSSSFENSSLNHRTLSLIMECTERNMQQPTTQTISYQHALAGYTQALNHLAAQNQPQNASFGDIKYPIVPTSYQADFSTRNPTYNDEASSLSLIDPTLVALGSSHLQDNNIGSSLPFDSATGNVNNNWHHSLALSEHLNPATHFSRHNFDSMNDNMASQSAQTASPPGMAHPESEAATMNDNMASQSAKTITSPKEDFPQFDPTVTSYSLAGNRATLTRSRGSSSKKVNNLLPAFGDDARAPAIDSDPYEDMPDIPSSPPILRRWSIVSAPAHYGENDGNRGKGVGVNEKDKNHDQMDIDSNDGRPDPNFVYHGPATPRAEPHDSHIKIGQTILVGRPRRYHYFETMNPKIMEKILSFIDPAELSYRGKMPDIIVAFRIMPKVYNPLIGKFYGQEAWILHEGNEWQFRGMNKLAVSTIKNILMCVCCCHLTDGQGIWFHPSKLKTENTGLTKLQQVILMPFLPPVTHIPVHNCKSHNQIGEFERFVQKFPYFLSPFDKVLRIQVIAALEPWIRRKELVKGAQECKGMVAKIDKVLGVEGKCGMEQKYRNWGRAMIMEWKAEKEKGDKWAYMDWRGVADKVAGPYQKDFESLIDWDKFDKLPDMVGPEDIAKGCKPS